MNNGALKEPEATAQSPLGRAVRDYVALAKPRIIALLLFTAFTGMVLAHGGLPPALPLTPLRPS